MKKALPMPLILGAVALAAIVAAVVLFRGVAGPQEFAAPPSSMTIPKYIFDKLPPAQQDKMRAQGYKVTEGAAPSSTQPTTAPPGVQPR